jgi:alanyl-tRNA synthetase
MRTPEQAEKNIVRGGGLLWRIFLAYEPDNTLTAKDAVKLTNTYGLSLYDIIMMAASHSLFVDVDGYVKLMAEEKITHAKPKL